MRNLIYFLKILKERGYRFTKVRKLVLDLFIKSQKPLSFLDIQKVFFSKGMPVNKTTIYRELTFLKSQGIIRDLCFGDNIKRYEIVPDDHRHHVFCVNCEKIEDIVLEKDLEMEEKAIARIKNFKVLNHSLEFYGICKRCQKRQVIQS